VVDGTALEMRHTCKGIVGSNPTLSATTPNNINDLYHNLGFYPQAYPQGTNRAPLRPVSGIGLNQKRSSTPIYCSLLASIEQAFTFLRERRPRCSFQNGEGVGDVSNKGRTASPDGYC
jgi:hypothetical protein